MGKREIAVSGAGVGGGKTNWVELFSFYLYYKVY